MAMRKAYVDTAAGQVHYRHRSGEGLPIVCLHQTASSSAMFEAFAQSYRGQQPIYALDTPGFGGSFDPAGQPTMPDYADMIAAAINALGLQRCHLFGHHTGASIAIELAHKKSVSVESLIMIGPVVLTPEERAAFKEVYPKDFAPKPDGSHLQAMWNYVADIGGNASMELHHREAVDTARAWNGHVQVYSTIWDQDFSALFETASVPMCIMCSENDILWPMYERAQGLRPDAVAKVLPGTNFQCDEAPEATADAVVEYLASL